MYELTPFEQLIEEAERRFNLDYLASTHQDDEYAAQLKLSVAWVQQVAHAVQ